MTALGVRSKVVANAGLEIEPRRDGAAPERLHFNLLRTLAEVPFALCLEPELIDIAAVPALSIPQIGLLTVRSEEHTSELQSLMRISYAVFCLTKYKQTLT